MTSIFDQVGETQFGGVDRAEGSAGFGDYLTRMADDLGAAKRAMHDLLEVKPGDRVLDVGCGTGQDVRALALRVGQAGRIVGLDNSQVLIDRAKELTTDRSLPVEYQVGDAQDLPFPDNSFDATRSERVLMHLSDPARALSELVRVTRPGGRILLCDPEHGMWALDAPDIALTRTLLTWWFDFIANPWIGRRTPALAKDAGLSDVAVSMIPIVLPSLEQANAMTGVAGAARAAAEQSVFTEAQSTEFDETLARADAAQRFLMFGALIVTTGRVPLEG